MFDDILLLTEGGNVVYWGPRSEILDYFESIGHRCPEHTNPAEFILDLISIDSSSIDNESESRERLKIMVREYQLNFNGGSGSGGSESKIDSPITTPITTSNSGIITKRTFNAYPIFNIKSYSPLRLLKSTLTILNPITIIKDIFNSLHRFVLLFQRALRQTSRDHTTNIARVSVSMVLAYVVGIVYSRDEEYYNTTHPNYNNRMNKDDVTTRVNVIAQAAINVGMLSLIKTLQLFKQERPVVLREFDQELYRPYEYVLAKTLSELPLDALVAGVFGWVLHPTAGK